MPNNQQPREGKPGTTDQWPRWEGPEENRPAAYLPAKDNLEVDHDAAGESWQDPGRTDGIGALQQVDDISLPRDERVRQRAFENWERRGRPEGTHDEDWFAAAQEIDAEMGETAAPVHPEMSGASGAASDPFEMLPSEADEPRSKAKRVK